MINILPEHSDDITFIRIVKEILDTLLSQYRPTKVHLVKVDRRFDVKWTGFQGKYLGARGVWNRKRLRIPPFNPKKIVGERFFEQIENDYIEGNNPKLHIHQRSEFNHERRIETIGDSVVFLWYSGETSIHQHASVMAYVIDDKKQSSWFVSFISKDTWQIKESWGISEQEVRFLFERMSLSR